MKILQNYKITLFCMDPVCVYIYKNINFTYLKFLCNKKKAKVFRTFIKFILQFMYILNICFKNKYKEPIKKYILS